MLRLQLQPRGPGTHSTRWPPGKRCSCNGLFASGTCAASGDSSSSRERGSTWRRGQEVGGEHRARVLSRLVPGGPAPGESPSPLGRVKAPSVLAFCVVTLAKAHGVLPSYRAAAFPRTSLLTFATTPRQGSWGDPRFPDEETGTPGGRATCPGPHSLEVVGQGRDLAWCCLSSLL